jgi:hypothetical protein
MTKLQEESYKWFKKQISNYRSKKQKDEEYKKMERRGIQKGSFISFNYKNPVGKGKKSLRWFDENPVDVILDIRGNDMLCLNFHYCPRVFRKSVILFIIKMNKQRIAKDKRFELTYIEMKEYLKRNGLEMMIHRYKLNRITNLKYIKGSDIKYIVELPSEKFIIQDKSISEDDLYAMIRSHGSASKRSKNKRFGR